MISGARGSQRTPKVEPRGAGAGVRALALAFFVGFLSILCGVLAFSVWLYAHVYTPPAADPLADWPGYYRAVDAPLTGWDDPRLRRATDETDFEFAERATRAVHHATYHCERTDAPHWLASLLSVFDILEFRSLGVISAKYFTCGFCHQRAYILARTLRDNGIEAMTYGLEGHVVTVFAIGAATHVADPDYGVGPFAVDISDGPAMNEAAAREYARLNAEHSSEDQKSQFRLVLGAYDRVDNDRHYNDWTKWDRKADRQEKLLDRAGGIKALSLFAALAFAAIGVSAMAFAWRRHRNGRRRG